MDIHLIHRVDEFLPHLASLQPHLLALLPVYEQPTTGMSLQEWILSIPQPRMMEICTLWVTESVRKLKESSPEAPALIRAALMMPSEFDLSDMMAVGFNHTTAPDNPMRTTILSLLHDANRQGLLIQEQTLGRYSVPFPVRLSLDNAETLSPSEVAEMRWRFVERFSILAEELIRDEQEVATNRHWRFANFMGAYEVIVDLFEEELDNCQPERYQDPALTDVASQKFQKPLLAFAELLGPELIQRQSDRGERLLAASAAAALLQEDTHKQADNFDLLAKFNLRRGRFDTALGMLNKVLTLRLEVDDQLGIAYGHCAVALCLREMNENESAIASFRRAIHHTKAHGLMEQEVDATNCLANLLLQVERPEEAYELFSDLLKRVDDTARVFPSMAESLVICGIAKRRLQKTEPAIEYLTRARLMATALPHRRVEALACFELASVYLSMNQKDLAINHFRQAADLFGQVSEYDGLCRSRLRLAELYLEQDRVIDVESLLKSALRHAQNARNRSLSGEVWRLRRRLGQYQGNRRAVVDSLVNEIRVLQFTLEAQHLVDAHLELARLYIIEESGMLAGMSLLRGQGIARAHGVKHSMDAISAMIVEVENLLTEEQWEFLLDEVSEELERGQLIGRVHS